MCPSRLIPWTGIAAILGGARIGLGYDLWTSTDEGSRAPRAGHAV